MESDERVNVFTVGMIEENNRIIYEAVVVTVKVTKPNEFGVFKIIIQIGDEEPIERLTTLNNEKIVKRGR